MRGGGSRGADSPQLCMGLTEGVKNGCIGYFGILEITFANAFVIYLFGKIPLLEFSRIVTLGFVLNKEPKKSLTTKRKNSIENSQHLRIRKWSNTFRCRRMLGLETKEYNGLYLPVKECIVNSVAWTKCSLGHTVNEFIVAFT